MHYLVGTPKMIGRSGSNLVRIELPQPPGEFGFLALLPPDLAKGDRKSGAAARRGGSVSLGRRPNLGRG